MSKMSSSTKNRIGKTKHGLDSNGNEYNSIDELWSSEFHTSDTDHSNNVDKSKWYNDGARYWQNADNTVDGMLGGLAHLSPIDIYSSQQFIKSLHLSSYNTVLDCGAGIGRVSKNLLCPLFKTVDMVEQDATYVDTAKSYINCSNMRHYYCSGLQSFVPQLNTYDMVWIQWVIGHLDDNDLVKFLRLCTSSLTAGGVICIKENNTRDHISFHVDRDDSSITRSDNLFKQLFDQAGLVLMREMVQLKFPKECFPVKMYALKPNK